MTDNDPNPQHAQNDGAPDYEETEIGGSDVPDEQMEEFLDWWKADRDHRHDWVQSAELWYNFRAGDQWDSTDREILEDQGRMAIVFNRIGPYIDAVSGMEINNRKEVRYIPRVMGPMQGADDLLSGAADWVRDGCDAEDEESDQFRDALTCGEGWTQTRMDYDEDPDGTIIIERQDPLMIVPDAASSKANYADMRHVFKVCDVPIEIARALSPGIDDEDLDAGWARDIRDDADDPHDARAAPFYRNDQSGRNQGDAPLNIVRQVEVEWWEYEAGYRVVHPTEGVKQLKPEEFNALKAEAKRRGQPLPPHVKDRRKVYYKALLGAVVLDKTDGAEKGGFTLKCVTGKRDHMKKCWYGLVRAMVDPQMWSNKWLSQTINIVNKNAKGGLMAELDAFEDAQAAENSWADPDAITWVTSGALQQGKIQPKPPIQFPAGMQQLMQYAVSSISDVIGANPEMMGQADQAQTAGVTVMQRRQSAMAIFADVFNSQRRYRKEQGRLMLWLIQTFISDGRLVKVGGQDNAQYVPLARSASVEYDIIIDDTPTSPNMKERVWDSLIQLFPMLSRMQIPPEVLLQLLDYSPLPSSLVAKIKQTVAQQQSQQKPPDPIVQAKVAVDQARAGHLQAQSALAQVQAQTLPAKTALDAQMQQAKIEQLRGQAAQELAMAGIQQGDQRFQNMMSAIDAMLNIHSAGLDAQDQQHGQAMDLLAARGGQQDQQHGQMMDVAQQGLAAQAQQAQQEQAAQAAAQPPSAPQ